MILVDANLLVYAFDGELPQHSASKAWLEKRLNGHQPIGMPWASLLAFARLVSNPRIFEHAVSVPAAWAQVEEWLDLDPVWTPLPTTRHRQIFQKLVDQVAMKSALVPDAHLAALAIGHDLTLCSADRDFARFPGLRWENPLAA